LAERSPIQHRTGAALLRRPTEALCSNNYLACPLSRPDTIRLGVCPLCTTFVELHTAIGALRQVVEGRLFEQYSTERLGVT
jgi:hypothetical protein